METEIAAMKQDVKFDYLRKVTRILYRSDSTGKISTTAARVSSKLNKIT